MSDEHRRAVVAPAVLVPAHELHAHRLADERRHDRRRLGRVVVRRRRAVVARALVVGEPDPALGGRPSPSPAAARCDGCPRAVDALGAREDRARPCDVTSATAQHGPIGIGRCSGTCSSAASFDRRRVERGLEVARAARALAPASCRRCRGRASASRGCRRPGSGGFSAHFTFSCAAAWIAAYSVGATTPRKSLERTTLGAGDVLDRALVDRDDLRRGAVAVRALAARPHDPAVEHPRHLDVVDVGELAGHLGRDVDARDAVRADELVLR